MQTTAGTEPGTPTSTTPSSASTGRYVTNANVNYLLIAMARWGAPRYLDREIDAEELVSAYHRLEMFDWVLGQRIDHTGYTARPDKWTWPELAIVIAEVDSLKGCDEHTDAEWAAIKADAEQLKRTYGTGAEAAARTIH